MNQNANFTFSPRVASLGKYNMARGNLLLLLIFTAINLFLLITQSDTYFLFSAEIPYFFLILGLEFYTQTAEISLLLIFAAVSLLFLAIYFVCWLCSKKHHGFMTVALVLFALDCALMVYTMVLSGEFGLILDILFHVWVMYYLIVGVIHANKLKKMPANTSDPWQNALISEMPLESTQALRRAENAEKSKVLVTADSFGHKIVYRRYGKTKEELIVDGYVYAEWIRTKKAKSNTINAVVSGVPVAAGFLGQMNFIAVSNVIIANTTRWT